jgi:UDP-N-acetylmuramate--alanine ligase
MKHAVKHIHFVGIGGAGMSGIAEILHNLGYVVSGTDQQASATTRRLQALGVAVSIGHDAAAIAGADAVVVSTAVKDDNPEVVAARAKRVPVVRRAEMLAELMRLKRGIAIAGTHGKTTTTSLVTSVLAEAGVDPTFVIGGRLNSAGAHSRLGVGDYIVVEADESDASFLMLTPVLSVVTNIDADHMETYGHDVARLRHAFVEFLHRMPFYGAAIVCGDDAGVQAILGDIGRPVVTYGLDEGVQVRAVDVQALPGGQMRFVAQRRNGVAMPDLPITLNLPGEHNVRNALAAIAVAAELELPDAPVVKALAGFTGVGRRFQRHGELPVRTGAQPPAPGRSEAGGSPPRGAVAVPGEPGPTFTLIDDYGHHPVEMAAVIAAARGAFPGRRLVLAFQPHRYTRTRDCFEDFVKVLGTADAVLLSEVYAAGEAPIVAADGRALARALRVAGKVDPLFVDEVGAMAQAIADNARDGDVVIVMGAGSIGGVPAQLVDTLKGPTP